MERKPNSPIFVTIEAKKDFNDPIFGYMDKQTVVDSFFDARSDCSNVEENHIIEHGYMTKLKVFFGFKDKSDAIKFSKDINKGLFEVHTYFKIS